VYKKCAKFFGPPVCRKINTASTSRHGLEHALKITENRTLFFIARSMCYGNSVYLFCVKMGLPSIAKVFLLL